MVNRMRANRAHRDNRRAHHALSEARITKDETGVIHLRHHMSLDTGMYRGRKIMEVTKAAKVEKVAKK